MLAVAVFVAVLVLLDLLSWRYGAESRPGFEVLRPGVSSTPLGPGRLVVGRRG